MLIESAYVDANNRPLSGGDSVSVFLGYAQFISSAPLDALAEPPWQTQRLSTPSAARFSVACMNENWENGAIASSRSVGSVGLLIGRKLRNR